MHVFPILPFHVYFLCFIGENTESCVYGQTQTRHFPSLLCMRHAPKSGKNNVMHEGWGSIHLNMVNDIMRILMFIILTCSKRIWCPTPNMELITDPCSSETSAVRSLILISDWWFASGGIKTCAASVAYSPTCTLFPEAISNSKHLLHDNTAWTHEIR